MKIKDVLVDFNPGLLVNVKGRVIAKRTHGSFNFIDIRDLEGKIQIITKKEASPNQQNLNLGNIVEIKGTTAFSKTGEESIIPEEVKMIVSCQEILPFKTGLKDKADRITYRHENFILDPELMRFFHKSSGLIFAIRRKLFEGGYSEFDTGTLQDRFDAGFAKPFKTHMNASDKECYLRLTSEIRLKQLIASGFEKVFELGKSFRNEGINPLNNPEFTLLEIYEAFATCEDLALLTENILSSSIQEAFGKREFAIECGTVDFKKPWQKISVEQLGKAKLGDKFCLSMEKGELLDLIQKHWQGSKKAFSPKLTLGQIWWDCIEKILVVGQTQPVFLTHIPSAISPLAKESSNIPGASERILLAINGIPIADFYTDENRVEILQPKLEAQSKITGKSTNPAFLHALKCGIPPTAGAGIGIERLLLCLRDQAAPKHIKEVILFPNA